jgi:hypothetical protein
MVSSEIHKKNQKKKKESEFQVLQLSSPLWAALSAAIAAARALAASAASGTTFRYRASRLHLLG